MCIYAVQYTLYGVQCLAIWSTMFGHIPYTAGIQYAAHVVQLVWMYVYVQCTTYTCHYMALMYNIHRPYYDVHSKTYIDHTMMYILRHT